MIIDVNSNRSRAVVDFTSPGFGKLVRLGRYNYNKTEMHLDNHVHKGMIEICYYDKGSQWFEVKNKRHLVKGGEVFIHYPDEVHGSGGYPEAKGTLYWLIMRVDPSEQINMPENATELLLRELLRLQRRHFKGGSSLKKLLEEIFTVIKSEDETSEIKQIRINLLVQSLLLKVIEYAKQKHADADNKRLQHVYQLVNHRLTEDISVSMLARESNLSESRFKNWFKELSGLTPMDYVQRKRVEYAVEQIKTGASISLKDLAYDLNFSSQQYFTTVIKKFTGKSPSELR